jgi:hypothetical protein
VTDERGHVVDARSRQPEIQTRTGDAIAATTRYGVAMPAFAIDSLPTDAFAELSNLMGLVGSAVTLIGVMATIVASRRACSPWVDRGLVAGLIGTAALLLGACIGANWWLGILAVMFAAVVQLIREQLPGRPERRRLQSSVSGLLTRGLWRVSSPRRRRALAAAVVGFERPGRQRTAHTLAQIRRDVAGEVLADAERDPLLDCLLDELAADIEAALQGVGGVHAEPSSAGYRLMLFAKISDFADCVLDEADRPDRQRAVRTYGSYSSTKLKLAATCRVAERELVGV